jgi:hypothetical protein
VIRLAARVRAWALGGVFYKSRFRSLAAAVGTHVRRIHVRFLFVVMSVFNHLAFISPLEIGAVDVVLD